MSGETTKFPQDVLDRIQTVTNKRARSLLDHIVSHGSVTTDELKTIYHYDHPPRAARDVRELGFEMKTVMVMKADGRRQASYVLTGLSEQTDGKDTGRKNFPKTVKTDLIARDKRFCQLCGADFPQSLLQIDHRVPYQVAGETKVTLGELMLLCGSCNRSKSWTCESCPNWLKDKSIATCSSCMLAYPKEYTHIATEQRRSLSLNWKGSDVSDFDQIKSIAASTGVDPEALVKALIKNSLGKK